MPQMSFRDIAKIFKKAGFSEPRSTGGSHYVFSDGEHNVTVPRHNAKPIKSTLLADIFQSAGLGQVLEDLRSGCGIKNATRHLSTRSLG